MLLSNSPVPLPGKFMLKRLRFADAVKRVCKYCFDQFQCAEHRLAVGLRPEEKFFAELRVENGFAPSPLTQCSDHSAGSSPTDRRKLSTVSRSPFPSSAQRIASNSLSAFFGERSRYAVSIRLDSSSAGRIATSRAPRRRTMTTSRSSITLSK